MMRENDLAELGLDPSSPIPCGHDGTAALGGAPERPAVFPATGLPFARLRPAAPADYQRAVAAAGEAFRGWRLVPAPRRGELVRRIAGELRRLKPALSRLVAMESGKIISEGEGEVQEMIDIADFAVGLSRQ